MASNRPGFDFEAAARHVTNKIDVDGIEHIEAGLIVAYEAGKREGGMSEAAKNLIDAVLDYERRWRGALADPRLVAAVHAYRGEPKPPRYGTRAQEMGGPVEVFDEIERVFVPVSVVVSRLNAAEHP